MSGILSSAVPAAVLFGAGLFTLALLVLQVLDPARRRAVRTLDTASTTRVAAPLLVRAAPEVRRSRLEDRLTAAVRGRLSLESLRKIETKLERAGLSAPWGPERVVILRVLLAVVGLVAGLVLATVGPTGGGLLVALLLPFLLYAAPEVWISRRTAGRQREMTLALADMLDLMTILVEAGIAFESAMIQAASSSEGPLSDEFERAIREIQVGVPRLQALRGVAERCEVADLSTVVAAIVQAERFGVPIARVLRVQSAELREKRRQRAEELAMKIPAKVVLPLGLCILPAMLIITVGPAVLSISRSFAEFG